MKDDLTQQKRLRKFVQFASYCNGGVKSWLNSMFEGYTEDSLQTDDNHEQSRYSYIFDYFDMGHLQDQSPEVLLAELSKKCPGGFPKEWKQVPFYCAFLLQNSLVVWVKILVILVF